MLHQGGKRTAPGTEHCVGGRARFSPTDSDNSSVADSEKQLWVFMLLDFFLVDTINQIPCVDCLSLEAVTY